MLGGIKSVATPFLTTEGSFIIAKFLFLQDLAERKGLGLEPEEWAQIPAP